MIYFKPERTTIHPHFDNRMKMSKTSNVRNEITIKNKREKAYGSEKNKREIVIVFNIQGEFITIKEYLYMECKLVGLIRKTRVRL